MIEVCKHIVNLVAHYKCGKFSIEELSFKGKMNNKVSNRLCKNVWHRNLLKEQISKRCVELNIELVEVNAAYSSFVGNLMYGNDECPDMVASSIEIARRGFKKFEKGWFYPELKSSCLSNQWKEELNDIDLESWKKLFAKIKKLGVKYRFSLAETVEFLRLRTFKSKVYRVSFI